MKYSIALTKFQGERRISVKPFRPLNTSGEGTLGQISDLTPSERKILKLIAQKKSTQEIADLLFVSSRTIEKHRSNIVAKLELPGQSNSLTNWAIENKSLLNNI